MVKKNYASILELQEGNVVPEKSQLDIKGINSMAKSSMALSTRNALKKILLEDILKAPVIDQFKIIKHIAILEKKILSSIENGSKEFYKPVTVKSQNNYADPMRITGIKSSYTWNKLKPKHDNLPYINLNERNAVDIAKLDINKITVERLKDKYPEVYENAIALMADESYKGKITSIAIPLDTKTPDWVLEMLDYKTIVNNNISGFVFESVGIERLDRKSVNYTNLLQL